MILEKKLDLKIYNPKEIPEFVKNDLSKNTGVNIISGHSNTNPVLLNELIQQPLFKDIPDENLMTFILSIFLKMIKSESLSFIILKKTASKGQFLF